MELAGANSCSRWRSIAAATRAGAQTPAASEWGAQVLDIHLHPRATVEGSLLHLDGSGVTKAVLLTGAAAEDRAKQTVAAHPNRFVRFASIDMTQPEAIDYLRKAAQGGAIGFGEIKSQVAAASPEMQRLYALAAELNLPITIHFQEVNQPNSPGTFNTGLKQFDAMLKKFPKTTFIGHADAFWANVSADYAEDTSYPKGPIKPGGVTDKFLGDYPNLYADMSANSGNNFLNRDPEFAAAIPRAPPEQADVRQRLLVRRRTRHVRPRRLGGPLHRARDADDAEEARAAGCVQEDRVGERDAAAKTVSGCAALTQTRD